MKVVLSRNAHLARSNSEGALARAIGEKIGVLKRDVHYGDPLAKRLIPPRYAQYGASNLFRIELPLYWRMIYTITRDEDGIVVLVLDIIDHKEYDKVFGYRKR